MRTRPGPVLLWLGATAAAIAVASVAIGQVGRQIALDTAIDDQLAQAATGTGVGAPEAGDDPGVDAPGGAGDVTDPEPGAASAPDGNSAPSPDADPRSMAVRTYDTIGGSAAIAISDGSVQVRWATPREGFRVSVEPSASGGELRVDFRSDAHRSRIKVELVGDQVVEEVEEIDR